MGCCRGFTNFIHSHVPGHSVDRSHQFHFIYHMQTFIICISLTFVSPLSSHAQPCTALPHTAVRSLTLYSQEQSY